VYNENNVVVIDTNNLEIVKQIPTGNVLFWLAVVGNHILLDRDLSMLELQVV
jgi:hypothetical protein